MKVEVMSVSRYTLGDGFFVEEVFNDEMNYWEYWIGHSICGIKSMAFGVPRSHRIFVVDYCWCDYVRDYIEEYMDD